VASDFLGVLLGTAGELLGDCLGEGGNVRLIFLLPPLAICQAIGDRRKVEMKTR
jgi:hypothetical protein